MENKTSIVILTYNQLTYTKLCIESIRKYTLQGSYELIVVDNASTDGTVEWLRAQPDIRCIFNSENYGFAKGCNQGIKIARGTEVLLLNNDTIVTKRWLKQLKKVLYSDEKIGVVSCLTNNCSNSQTVAVNYKSTEEMQAFAASFNQSDPAKWEKRPRLIMFCYLIKKSVMEKVGLLDEEFGIGNFEDDDYSLRVTMAGFELICAGDTFIHHFGTISFGEKQYALAREAGLAHFKNKWGFDISYYAYQRDDLISFMRPAGERIKVLEIGCGLGATLLKIKNMYRGSEVYGVELNEKVAAVANHIAPVAVADIERYDLPFAPETFDYIIFGDVLEHLCVPWDVVQKMRAYLKPGGAVLASIPNVMHWSVVQDLLAGNWTYQEAGILDKTHLRFFTFNEIVKMFKIAGYAELELKGKIIGMDKDTEAKFGALREAGLLGELEALKVYQWLVKAEK